MSRRVWALTVLALLVATAIMMIQRQQTYANLRSTHSILRISSRASQVIVTDDGSTFHTPGCKYIQGKHPHAMDAAQAVAYGYTPCVRCMRWTLARWLAGPALEIQHSSMKLLV